MSVEANEHEGEHERSGEDAKDATSPPPEATEGDVPVSHHAGVSTKPHGKATHPLHKPPLDPRVLRNVIINYEGETLQVPLCDDPVYHGQGTAVFRTGFTYTGDFHFGRMHGHGRIEWTSGVVFEGAFVDNEMQGQGVYTWPNGSSYTGDVVRGKRHGQGIFRSGTRGSVSLNEQGDPHGDPGSPYRPSQPQQHHMAPLCFSYHADGGSSELVVEASSNARFEGQWVDGLPHGAGVLVFDDDQNVRYEGTFRNGKRHGHGEMRYASGNVYVGEWVDDIKCGHGTMLWMADPSMTTATASAVAGAVEKYDGNWLHDRPHGHGHHVWLGSSAKRREKNWYEGEFASGVRHGRGTFFYANGARYEGEWLDNVKHGRGVFYYEDGRVVVGDFCDDRAMEGSTTTTTTTTTTSSDHHPAMSATSKIVLFVDDLLPVDAQDKARKLIEHAVLRLNTDLRALYRQYTTHPSPHATHSSPTRQSVSPLKPPPVYTSDDGSSSDPGAMLMEYYECRRLLADSGLRLSGGHLESLLQQIRDAQRDAAGVTNNASLPVVFTTDPVTLAVSLPEVIPAVRFILYREFVELLVRLAFEQQQQQQCGGDEAEAAQQKPIASLAEAFAGFHEQLTHERQQKQHASRTNDTISDPWTASHHQQLHTKELHSIYQKHHHAFQRLFAAACHRPQGRLDGVKPMEHPTPDGQDQEDDDEEKEEASCPPPPQTVAVRSLLSLLMRELHVFSSSFRVRHALAALQVAFSLTDNSNNTDTTSDNNNSSSAGVSLDPFFGDIELVFTDFLDAIAIILLTKQHHHHHQQQLSGTSGVASAGRSTVPLFAIVDEFVHTLPALLS